MFLLDDLISGRALGLQALVQPYQRRRHLGVLIAQPLDQLNRKSSWQWPPVQALQSRLRRFGLASPDAQQTVGQRVRILARRPAPDDALGRPPQILHQDDSQRNRDCPQFADR